MNPLPNLLQRRAELLALVIFLSLMMGSMAHADWLDEMPSVDDVARAVREMNRQDASSYRGSGGLRRVNGIDPGSRRVTADDQDWYAARLAGTFEMLRWFMLFEALRETNPDVPNRFLPLSAPKEVTMVRAQKIAAKYREAELALWTGVGKRPSYNKRLCDAPDSFLNRFGQKMYTRQECYQKTFRGGAHLHHNLAYRQAIFPLLFCDEEKGRRYHNRYQEYYIDGFHGTTIVMGSLRVTGPDRPHNYVYKRIKLEKWPQLARTETASQVCESYGGDLDGDGICDAWEVALRNPKAEACTANSLCPDTTGAAKPPYSSIDEAAWAALRKAVGISNNYKYKGERVEWGGYIYPVPGGYRYLSPVTSNKIGEVDLGAVADPAFSGLFPNGKPASCKHVATYHTHPAYISVPGLSLADMKESVDKGVPYYVMKTHFTESLYVYRPGKSADADDAIRNADPWTWALGLYATAEVYYIMRYIDTLKK